MFMLRFIIILCCFVNIAYSAPTILFSDLTAGPNTGWDINKPAKGAVVTIWGHGFGSTRSSSFVSVGGVSLSKGTDYIDAWGKTHNPSPFLESITFHLNNSMPKGNVDITVTVDGTKSNSISFNINDGRVFFTDSNSTDDGDGTLSSPWKSPASFLGQLLLGDILYFREGIYDGIYNGGQSNIWIRSTDLSGTVENPFSLVGYPGEKAVLETYKYLNSQKSSGVKIDASNWTISKLFVNAYLQGLEGADNVRIIGNDVKGAKQVLYGTGIIVLKRNNGKALGNTVHEARSADRFDHGIYITGCAATKGNELGWNFLYDNNYASGPNIVVNHQGTRCGSDVYVKSHYIHHNVIECKTFASRGIGIFDQSWDVGEVNQPEPVYVYNNIVYHCGGPTDPSVYQNSAHVIWFNNAILESQGTGFSLSGDRLLSSKVFNNIITLKDSTIDYLPNNSAEKLIVNNVYFGGKVNTDDPQAINQDPLVEFSFSSPEKFNIMSGSPAINSGEDIVGGFDIFSLTNIDFNGVNRVRGAVDVGPAEYINRPNPPSGLGVN